MTKKIVEIMTLVADFGNECYDAGFNASHEDDCNYDDSMMIEHGKAVKAAIEKLINELEYLTTEKPKKIPALLKP